MGEGEFALVREHLEASLHSTSWWVSDHDIYAMLVDVVVLQRDEVAIRQYAPAAEELAMRYGHTLYQAIVHRAWGVAHRLAGEYAEAEARLHQALDLFSSLGTRWQLGRTLYELGEVTAEQTNTDAARNYFTRALAQFEALRAAPDMARTQAALEKFN
ncbi:MAG TPA: tetratricopeptide repeat protein [Chloroflexota bacterium]|nr:tetratricopeptide repeat protein [Chloroflexota bacterium]HUM67228.1 tetratricopeptide repeat protein [Chloroflexota bacterium]